MSWLRSRFWLIEVGYLVLIAPFVLFPNPTRVLVLLGIPVMWLISFLLTGHFVPSTPLNRAILLLLLTVSVSIFVTDNLPWSLPKIAGLVWGIALFFATVNAVAVSRGRLIRSFGLFVLAGFGLALVAPLGMEWPEGPGVASLTSAGKLLPILAGSFPGAPDGLNPNEVAGTLLWFMPLCVAFLVVAAGDLRHGSILNPRKVGLILVLGIFVVVQSIALLITFSRSAWVGYVMALFVTAILAGRPGRIVALGSGALTVVGIWLANTQSLALSSQLIALLGRGSWEGRQQHWSAAIMAIRMSPLTGLGMNMYRKVVHTLFPQFLFSYDAPHAHNMWLQIILDLGVFGLVAYTAILLTVAVLLVQAWRSVTDQWLRACLIGSGAGLLGHALFGMTDAVALGAKPGVAFWILLSLIVGLHRFICRAPEAVPARSFGLAGGDWEEAARPDVRPAPMAERLEK